MPAVIRALAGVLAALALAGAARAEPALWTVRDADTTIVLFGSFHQLKPGVAWRTPAFDAAAASADELWLETETGHGGDPAETLRRGRGPEGWSLCARLSPTTAAALLRVRAADGERCGGLDGMLPWLAALTLQWDDQARRGLRRDAGVETVALAAAPDARRVGLETPETLLAAFADAALDDQIAYLELTLRQIEGGARTAGEDPAFRDWLAGDVVALDHWNAALRDAAPDTYRRLATDRNRRWAERIAARMNRPGRVLVVVGAAHLAGADGVPAALRGMGLNVEGP